MERGSSFIFTSDYNVLNMEIKKLWDSALVQIEMEVSKANFSTWFKDTHVVKFDDGIVHIGVPNIFVKDWLSTKFHKTILQSLRNTLETIRSVEYMISQNKLKESEEVKEIVEATKKDSLEGLFISPDDNLNPRYTFDTFVVGPFNELAFAAAQAILKKPVAYNPLFYYGNTGLGKTHLMQAVGNSLKAHHKDARILYVTSEKFTMDYVAAVQSGKMTNFKEKYRKYDVFIMDDIQFLSNKEKTQEELFHLFNYMYDNNKQIVFSSDVHPTYLQNLEDRLKSRFMAGMVVDISPLDNESKIAIIQNKMKVHQHDLAQEVIFHLANTIEGSIRELEGILNSIIGQAQLKGRALSLNEVKNITKNSAKPHKTVSVKDVVRAVSAFYNIEEQSIYNKTRRQEVVKPRQVAMYILREDYNVSFPSIGQKFGGRDHTTAIHSCEKIKEELKNNSELAGEINQIRAMI